MTNTCVVEVPNSVDDVPTHASEMRLPPTPESHDVPLPDPQQLGGTQTPDATPLSHPALASSRQVPNRGMPSQPLQPKSFNLGGKGSPLLQTKVPEGKRTEGAGGIEESEVKPTSGHGLPVLGSVERKVGLHCIYKPTPLTTCQAPDGLGRTAERIELKTYQTLTSPSTATAVPRPELSERRQHQPVSISKSSVDPIGTQSLAPYEHNRIAEGNPSTVPQNYSSFNNATGTPAPGSITPGLPIVSLIY